MTEYIERKAAMDIVRQTYGNYSAAFPKLRKLPAADVAPVRHGRWIDKPTGRYGQWQAWCSECNERCGCGGTIESQHKKFCPNCGARMDLEVNNVEE